MQLRSGSALNNAAGGVTARLPQILHVAGFKGSLCGVEGRGQGRRGEGLEGRRSSGDADSDAKLLPNA